MNRMRDANDGEFCERGGTHWFKWKVSCHPGKWFPSGLGHQCVSIAKRANNKSHRPKSEIQGLKEHPHSKAGGGLVQETRALLRVLGDLLPTRKALDLVVVRIQTTSAKRSPQRESEDLGSCFGWSSWAGAQSPCAFEEWLSLSGIPDGQPLAL